LQPVKVELKTHIVDNLLSTALMNVLQCFLLFCFLSNNIMIFLSNLADKIAAHERMHARCLLGIVQYEATGCVKTA